MNRIVVVGGGYGGTSIARGLDAVADVQLIEPRDQFVHNVAAIRALVDASWLDRVAIPYDRLLRRGTHIQDCAVEIRDGMVRLLWMGLMGHAANRPLYRDHGRTRNPDVIERGIY
jgi:hypothetical protein